MIQDIRHKFGRRNLDPKAAEILRGMLYRETKKTPKEKNTLGLNQHSEKEVKGQNDPKAKDERTSEKVAKECGVSEATVRRSEKMLDAPTNWDGSWCLVFGLVG